MKIAAAIVFLFFAGCAANPEVKLINATPEEIQSADYGKFPDHYKLIIGNFMLLRMYRPSGAKYDFKNKPFKKWVPGNPKPQFGYGVCADISAPLGDGKFEKARPYFFLIKNNDVILFLEKPEHFYCLPIRPTAKSSPRKPEKLSGNES